MKFYANITIRLYSSHLFLEECGYIEFHVFLIHTNKSKIIHLDADRKEENLISVKIAEIFLMKKLLFHF
jgi:hypothetical protein